VGVRNLVHVRLEAQRSSPAEEGALAFHLHAICSKAKDPDGYSSVCVKQALPHNGHPWWLVEWMADNAAWGRTSDEV
jgi:hypothetical protein